MSPFYFWRILSVYFKTMILSKAKRDLMIAKKAIKRMNEAKQLSELVEEWENFLYRIERAWEFTARVLKDKKTIQQWHKPYTTLRKKDDLLIYLKQARNSEMHCISETTTKPIKFLIQDQSGHGLQIDSIDTKFEDGKLTIDLKSPDLFPKASAKLIPTVPQVMRFKNRGVWYEPPSHHLKKKIKDLHPASLAKLGLTFYKTYIEDASIWLENH